MKSLLLSVLALLLPWFAEGIRSEERSPNVVLIMTDDQGWGDIRSHGNEDIDTPTLDRLAAEGTRLDRFYVCPVCAPTRASLLSGRYHFRTGVTWVTRQMETMRAEETTLAEVFKANGYHTGCFGKWHNGAHYPEHPNGQGFEEFFGFCAGHWNNYFSTTLEHNGKPVKTEGYITDVLTDQALTFIEEQEGEPFFCYVPYNAPHSPWQVPDKYFDKYKKRNLDDTTACAYGMVENIDDNVKRILTKLDERKLAENTIVIFTTDNGPNSDRYNGGMKGRKGSVDEGGVRVPCFIRWPGRIPAKTTLRGLAAHIDMLPTLVELCGLKKPKTLPLDGISLAPALLGKESGLPERMIFSVKARPRMQDFIPGAVRTPQYRLVLSAPKKLALYDMRRDPGQKKNIAEENPELVAKLSAAYRTWFKETARGVKGRPPVQIGHEQAPVVEIPAHELHLEGGVRYKGGQGWANDWITNWRSPEDRIAAEVSVVQPGPYEVSLLYTVPEVRVGAKVRLTANEQTLESHVTRAHDPKPIPGPDRVPRKEVFEKEWAELRLGVLNLTKGRHRIILQAPRISEQKAVEVKGLVIRTRRREREE